MVVGGGGGADVRRATERVLSARPLTQPGTHCGPTEPLDPQAVRGVSWEPRPLSSPTGTPTLAEPCFATSSWTGATKAWRVCTSLSGDRSVGVSCGAAWCPLRGRESVEGGRPLPTRRSSCPGVRLTPPCPDRPSPLLRDKPASSARWGPRGTQGPPALALPRPGSIRCSCSVRPQPVAAV